MDTGLRILLAGLCMSRNHIYALHHYHIPDGDMTQNLSLLALVFAGDNPDPIVFLYSHGHLILRLLNHFRRKGENAHVFSCTQLSAYGTENTGSLGFSVVVDNNRCIIVETNI